MGWGIKDDPKMESVPGTTLLSDQAMDLSVTEATSHLKHRDGLVLVPQPSESPNDPLNWSVRRKNTILGILAIAMTTIMSASGVIATAIQWLSTDYHTEYQNTVRIITVPKVITGALTFFFVSAIAAVWGKRVQIVLGGIAIIFVQLAGYWYNSLAYLAIIGGFQGVFAAPIEMLLGAIVVDMYFVHERARKLAFIGTLAIIGNEIGAVIASQIIGANRHKGLQNAHLISAAVLLPCMILVYLYCPETTYNKRQVMLEQDFHHHEIVPEKLDGSTSTVNEVGSPVLNEDKLQPTVTTAERTSSTNSNEGKRSAPTEQKDSFKARLKIFHGRLTDRKFFVAITQPFPLMLFPSVMFSTVVNGAYMVWGIYSGYIIFQAFAEEPYSFTPNELGLLGIPSTVTTLIFNYISGWVCDWLARTMAKKNKGIYEPEYRLLMMAPAVVLSTIGFVLQGQILKQSWDWKKQNPYWQYAQYMKPAELAKLPPKTFFPRKRNIYMLVAVSQLHFVAGPFATAACLTYILDCNQKNATEAFVGTTLFKSLFTLVGVLTANSWYAAKGPLTVFNTLAIVNASVVMLTIPMYIYGKRFRGAVARNNFLTNATKVA